MNKALVYIPSEGVREDFSVKDVLKLLQSNEKIVAWVSLKNPTERDYTILAEDFKFHPLAIEDCESSYHLPKIDNYGDYLFLIWHAAKDIPETEKIETAEVDIFIGENFLVTIYKEDIPVVDEFYESCRKSEGELKKGADWLLHSLLDRMVDEYFPLVDRISNEIDVLEDDIFKNPSQEHLKKLFTLKHQMLALRKIVFPQREVVVELTRYGVSFIGEKTYIYFQDIYDHLIRIVDMIDTSRDVITGAMDIYLSTVSNRMNDVMKKLTVVATIFMPLTLLTGIYGMNFRYMPELYIKGFYFGVLGFMGVVAAGMLIYFKRIGWW